MVNTSAFVPYNRETHSRHSSTDSLPEPSKHQTTQVVERTLVTQQPLTDTTMAPLSCQTTPSDTAKMVGIAAATALAYLIWSLA